MAIACCAFMAVLDLETTPVGLLAALLMTPAPVLYVLAATFTPAREYIKHIAYFAYIAIWILLFVHSYLTADDYIPDIAQLSIALVSTAAVSGYFPLIWSKRFSLRTLVIATTLVAAALGAIVWAVN